MCVRALALGEAVALGCAGMTVYVVIPEPEDHNRYVYDYVMFQSNDLF